MEFPGVSMKEVACGKSIQGLIKKEVDFSGVIKKVNVEFQGGSWFLVMKFPRGGTRFCGTSSKGDTIMSGIFKGKQT